MGRAIVITSGKGGVGKTTTTANLGASMARKGYRVILIDADIGLRNLDVVMGLENRIVFHLVDVVNGKCDPEKALIKDRRVENLFLLPSSQTDKKEAVSPEHMRELVSQLKTHADFVLIDCPAGIEQGFENAIAGADEAIVVAVPEVASIRDADRVAGLLAAAQLPTRLIVNRISEAMVARGAMLSQEDVIDILALDLLGAVPMDDAIVSSSNKGIPACLDNARSGAARAYERIASQVCGDEVQEEPAEATGFFGRLGRALGLSPA